MGGFVEATVDETDDLRDKLEARDKACIDGVVHLAHWTGNAPSAQGSKYREGSDFPVMHVGPRRSQLMTHEGLFDCFKRSSQTFNLRMGGG